MPFLLASGAVNQLYHRVYDALRVDYDLYIVGRDGEKMHGLYKFKTGFGGSMFHQLGCWDYPLDEKKYHAFAAHEMGMAGYYA